MRARVGEIELEYELLGPEDGEPLVLICGMFQQLTSWPEPFLDELTSAGFHVLVFDNRDVGLSTWETRPAPDVLGVFGGDISTVNYTSYDLAADTVGLMDAVGWDSAHVFGHSMGSGIAQLVATEYPERVRTLTLFGSSPFDGVSGRADDRFVALVITPVADSDEARWQRTLESYRIVFEPALADEDELIAYSRRQFDRAPNPRMQCVTASRAAQEIAMNSSPTHEEKLRALPHRTLLLHGTGDLAVAFDGGEALAALIPDAKLVRLDGMGHMTIDPKFLSTMAGALIEHAGL